MHAFYKSFLREAAESPPRVCLAAFGKHPAWDDHIDDIGLATDSLALAKERIYLEGLSSQIDSGVWDKLEPANRLEGFDHVFLWQRGVASLLGCMVSSVDGKGRSRYPMILCAQFAGVPLQRVLGEMCPIIEQAVKQCRAALTTVQVQKTVSEAREKLCRMARALPARVSQAPLAGLARLEGEAALGPANEGLVRILYQVKNHLAPWAPGRAGGGTATGGGRAVLLRVPQIFARAEDGLEVWSEFLGAQLDPEAPRLLIWPRAGSWVDALVGDPGGADFFGLRANTHALPCASDVPYEVDAVFRREVATLLAESRNGKKGGRSIFGVPAAVPSARQLARHAASAGEKLQHHLQDLRTAAAVRPKCRWFFWGAVALSVIVIVLLALAS